LKIFKFLLAFFAARSPFLPLPFVITLYQAEMEFMWW